ncbi:MAG: chemotaxis protein CheA [Dehalococcoidales bacterium]|nr:chemotaxis protein CheA [Dehalococcoidales bacterium]
MSLQFDAAPDELAVFIEEAEEQLQLLDQDILILEKEGPNSDLLQEVFRAAHTLKGSSGAIGHERMASLTHAMEGILDSLRKGKLETTTALIDLLLQSLDALRVLKEEVVTLEHSGLDPSSLVQSLKRFLEDNLSPDGEHQPVGEVRPVAVEPHVLSQSEDVDGHTYVIVVYVDKDCAFPAVRCLQVHMALAEAGEVTESIPSRADIEVEKVGFELRLTYVTAESSQGVRDLIMAIPDIAAVRIENTKVEGDVVTECDAFSFDGPPQIVQEHDQVRGNAESAIAKDRNLQEGRANAKNVNASKTVRIDIERLDALMNLVGELVIDCTRLVQLSSRLQARYEGDEIAQGLGETSQHIQRITDELQDRIMGARMFPVSSVFNRFPRMIRDLAQRAGKNVEFVMEGEETELDRSVIEEIGDPLIHLLRNAVDHGIDSPDERRACGKPEVGLIRLSACHRESRIVLVVEDDGKGIDPERIRRAATEKGLLSPDAAARLSDREAVELIFAPGFSTAKQVSDVSGRGVGMDIVRTNIHKLNGSVSIESSPGRGTKFILELPLTLAIMDALLVSLGGNTFAIPLASVTETLRVQQSEVFAVNRGKVIQLRGRVLPLLPLGKALGLGRRGGDMDEAYVVVVGSDNDQVGILVDSLVGEQQVVIKSLGNYIGDIRGLSGATILGDGQVALIVDVPALVKMTIQERAGDLVNV